MLVYVRRESKQDSGDTSNEKIRSTFPPDRALKVVRSLNQSHDEKCDEYYKKLVLLELCSGLNELTVLQRKGCHCAFRIRSKTSYGYLPILDIFFQQGWHVQIPILSITHLFNEVRCCQQENIGKVPDSPFDLGS